MDELEKYYQYLRSKGADVAPTFQSFKATLSDEGNARKYHSYLRSNNFDAPESFDSFYNTLGFKTTTKPSKYTAPTLSDIQAMSAGKEWDEATKDLPKQKDEIRELNMVKEKPIKPKQIVLGRPSPSPIDFEKEYTGKEGITYPEGKPPRDKSYDRMDYVGKLQGAQNIVNDAVNTSQKVIDKYIHGKINIEQIEKERAYLGADPRQRPEKPTILSPSILGGKNEEYEKLFQQKKSEALANAKEVLGVIARDKEKKDPEGAKELQASMYALDNKNLADATGEQKMMLENFEKIKKGKLVNINGRAVEPIGALESISEGLKEKERLFNLYEMISSGDDKGAIQTLNDKLNSNPFIPEKRPEGKVANILHGFAGTPFAPIVAGTIGGLVSGGVSTIASAATGGLQFGKLEHAAELERVYMELKQQYPEMPDEEAFEKASIAGDRAHISGAITGAALGAIPTGKMLPVRPLTAGFKTATMNALKNIGKEGLIGLGIGGIAAGGQMAKNITAQSLGLDRGTHEGFGDQLITNAFLHYGTRLSAGVGKLLKRDQKAVQVGMARNFSPEEIKATFDEQIEQGIVTPAEANKAQKEIADIREQDSKIPQDITDESRNKIAKLQVEYDRLDKEMETEHKTTHAPKKERQKEIEEEILTLSKDKVKPTEAEKVIAKAKDDGVLTDVYEVMATKDPEGFLKFIADQAQGIDESGRPTDAGAADQSVRSQFGDKLVDKAIELYPAPKVEAEKPRVTVSTPNIVNVKLKENAIQERSPKEVSMDEASRNSETLGERRETEKGSTGEGTPPPPTPPTEKLTQTGGEGEGAKELDKLANNIPDSGRVAEYMSKETIEKYTGETPTNDQTRGIQELQIALQHGEKIIDKAKEVFGNDYVEKTLDYIEESKAGTSNKALMYVSLENALGREKVAATTPEMAAEITKQQALVYAKSQAFARENSLALNYQKLRKIAEVGYDINKVTDSFFSAEEKVAKNAIEKAVEADGDAINKEAQEQETISPEVEKAIQEGVEKEVAKLYEALPKDKKTAVDKAIEALEKIQKNIRGKTYESTLGVPVAILDAGITTIKLALKAGVKIKEAIELGIAKIKEKYGKPFNEDELRKDFAEGFKTNIKSKEYVKDALIAQGFGREINVKGEKKQILDWKKLAGAAGTVSKISENVAKALEKDNYTPEQLAEIQKDFVQEYVDLRTYVIEKAQNELAARNKESVTPEQKSAAKKLSELYTYGLFEKNADEFETAINKALGAKVSEEGFMDAKKIAKGLETIYSSSFKGVKLNDISAKAAIEKLEDQLRILLFREAKKQGNFNLKAASIVRNYFEIQQTMILNNLKQAVENPFSGLQQNLIDKLQINIDKSSTPELATQRRNMMKNIYTDMILHGGITYGKIESQFVNRQHIDDYVNKLSDNKLYHGIASAVTGKATLNAMDAMFKAGITEKKFTGNLIKILTHETNPKRMSKQDAVKFVSERLTGQTFVDAQKTAKTIIDKINNDAGTELIGTNQAQVDRFANDIVKASLEMGGKITNEQITAAYNAGYKAAGLGLGHEANNILSSTIKGYSARLEGDINHAIKNKEWNRAAALTYKSILFRNVLNPFVGGGTNWLVLKLEKTGLGLVTGLAYQIGSKSKIDVGTELGMQRLEERLYNHARYKDNYMRGLVGGIASTLAYVAYKTISGSDDDYRKWRGKNPWASRYADIITPEIMLFDMAEENDAMKKYFANSFNRNDAFDATNKVIKAADYAAKDKSNEAWGSLGEALGSKLNAPVPWRLVKDGQVIYQGITGQDPYHGNYKPSTGFLNGLFQGGALEYLGLRPEGSGETKGKKKKVVKE